MIQVESITITEFRGIRKLTLDFKGKNFGICGPNGTGKSGVIDALEFGLTGNVSRLSGEGSGEIALKLHGPHVDMRNAPDKASVILNVSLLSLGKSVTIERNLKNPNQPKVNPSDQEILEALSEVQVHPEIVLSRRELIRYVLATPGNRAREVEALLQLNQVEKVRTALQKIANSCEKQLPSLTTGVTQARDNLLRALDITELTNEHVLAAVNTQRKILNLPGLKKLSESTIFKDGMSTLESKPAQNIPKTQALADLLATHEAIKEITGGKTAMSITEATAVLVPIVNDPAVIEGLQRTNFYQTGMNLTKEGLCPFCDTPWDIEELKKHVQVKKEHLEKVSQKIILAKTKTAPLIVIIQKLKSAMESCIKYFGLAKPHLICEEACKHLRTCETYIERLTAIPPTLGTIAALENLSIIPPTVLQELDKLELAVNALPEPTKEDSARDYLTLGQERHEVFHQARRMKNIAVEKAEKARKVSDIYVGTCDQVLTAMYEAVEKDFESFYRFVNRGDEDDFKAQLIPSMGKLGFNVDFYGRGYFPPGAYHSEGTRMVWDFACIFH